MARSGGIVFAAVLVFIGSAFTVLMAALAVLGVVVGSFANRASDAPRSVIYFEIVSVVVLLGFGGWGIASGVGLIKTKQWARISILIFAAFLLLVSLPSSLIIAVIPMPGVSNPDLPTNFMVVMRAGMAIFYGLLGALGGFWIYFFNRKSVKAQFRGEAAPDTMMVNATGGRPLRPLSITIIGWILLIGSCLTPLTFPFWHIFFPDQPFPMCVLGIFFFGWSAFLLLFVFAAAQIAAAVGLLKLKPWGRLLAIWLQVFGLLNVVMVVGIPANRLRYQQVIQAMTASMNAGPHQTNPFVLPSWFGAVVSLLIILVVLWFLVTQRKAFGVARQESTPQV